MKKKLCGGLHSKNMATFEVSISLSHFIKHKPLISEECSISTILTLKAIPRTTSSVFAPSGGAASPWADSPNEDDVDILEEFEEPAASAPASAEVTLENSTEDEDKGGAEDTDGLVELDDVELPFDTVRWWGRVITSIEVGLGGCRGRSRWVGLVCTAAEVEDAEASSAAFTAMASVEDIR